MSSPERTPEPDGRRVESIKQYYQQLCASYRMVSQQLQHPGLPPARRQTLSAQLEKLQQALQDFTDRVIKPIVNARGSPRSSAGISTPSTPKRPRLPPLPLWTPSNIPTVNISQYLQATEPSEGVLLEKSFNGGRNANALSRTGVETIESFLARHPGTKVDAQVKQFLLNLADQFLANICRGICESARHRKRPGITTKDVELVLGKEMGMAVIAAGIPHAVAPAGPTKTPVKKSAGFTPHHARLQQLRKHGII